MIRPSLRLCKLNCKSREQTVFQGLCPARFAGDTQRFQFTLALESTQKIPPVSVFLLSLELPLRAQRPNFLVLSVFGSSSGKCMDAHMVSEEINAYFILRPVCSCTFLLRNIWPLVWLSYIIWKCAMLIYILVNKRTNIFSVFSR